MMLKQASPNTQNTLLKMQLEKLAVEKLNLQIKLEKSKTENMNDFRKEIKKALEQQSKKTEKVVMEKMNDMLKTDIIKETDEKMTLLKHTIDKSMSSTNYILTHFTHRNGLKKITHEEIHEMLSYCVNKKTKQREIFKTDNHAIKYMQKMYENKELAEYISDRIIDKYYTKSDNRMFFNTDLARNHYIVRCYEGNKYCWVKDASGEMLIAKIIKPIVDEIFDMIDKNIKDDEDIEKKAEYDPLRDFKESQNFDSKEKEKMHKNIIKYISKKFHFKNPTKAIA